jgi:hypothetical protein
MTPIEVEVADAKRKIFRDGYDLSFGEIESQYLRGELIIHPEYQRLFRWDDSKKTRFIESVLLNIPIPPIFVFSRPGGAWELVDGLQRIATVLEFMGVLKDPDGVMMDRYTCDGTEVLPSLENKKWPKDGETGADFLPGSLQFAIRRTRIRVEILGDQTDEQIKYELFQRLNTGGAVLSEQEVRACVIVSINPTIYRSIAQVSTDQNFIALTRIGEEKERAKYRDELVVRSLVLRNVAYKKGLDVHEYLDRGIISLCKNKDLWLIPLPTVNQHVVSGVGLPGSAERVGSG